MLSASSLETILFVTIPCFVITERRKREMLSEDGSRKVCMLSYLSLSCLVALEIVLPSPPAGLKCEVTY